MSGYYCMKRGWQDHELFEGEPYSKRDAWEWLIANAYWKDRERRINGKRVFIKRGQLSHSIRFLARKWGWTPAKTQRFLNALKNDTMIDTSNDTGQLVVTICNYDEYQNQLKESDTVDDTQIDTESIQQRYKEEERKEGKKEEDSISYGTNVPPEIHVPLPPKTLPPKKTKIAYSEEFEKFWELYPPNGASKAEAWKSYEKSIKTGTTHEEIERGVKDYSAYLCRTKTPTAHATTWLNQQRWTVHYGALDQGGNRQLFNGVIAQIDRRDPATRARDIGEEIIAKRHAERERESTR